MSIYAGYSGHKSRPNITKAESTEEALKKLWHNVNLIIETCNGFTMLDRDKLPKPNPFFMTKKHMKGFSATPRRMLSPPLQACGGALL